MKTTTRRKVPLADFVVLVSLFVIDVGLLLHTAIRVSSHSGYYEAKLLFFLLYDLIIGGLYILFGIHSLNETLRDSPCDTDALTMENLRVVSPTYTVTMLVYGSMFLLAAVAGILIVVNP